MIAADGSSRRAVGLAVISLVVALTSFVVEPAPAGAQTTPTTAAARPSTSGTDPVLDEVTVDATPATRAADGRFASAQVAEGRAQAGLVGAQVTQAETVNRSKDAAAAVTDAERGVAAAQAELERQQAALAGRVKATATAKAALVRERRTLRVLVGSIFTNGTADPPFSVGTFDEMTADQRRTDIQDRTVDIQSDIVENRVAALAAATGAEAAQRRRTDDALTSRRRADAALADAVATRDDLERLVAEAGANVLAAEQALTSARDATDAAFLARRPSRFLAPVRGTDLSLVDLHAYWLASATAPCPIPWWLLAGVGSIESGHGTAQGSTVEASGNTTKRILGIALNGGPGVAVINDSDGGLLDGDAVHDRAVGPMQFIPSTWKRWASDGNGDGAQDPHNLYDAAAAAANYLCAGRTSVTDEASMRSALFSYNRSEPYATSVLDRGARYRDLLSLPAIPPAGTTTELAGRP